MTTKTSTRTTTKHTATVLSLLAVLLLLSSWPVSAQSLPFRILEEEQQKKGGSVTPPRPPKYVLLVVRAVLTDPKADLAKPVVEATLRELLRTLRDRTSRKGERIDGISAFLYQSADHRKGGGGALGVAEWWPKEHSFNPDNAANIENKATYVETVKVGLLPQQAPSVVSRLPEATRREIYAALVRSQDKAGREADAMHPADLSKVPIDKVQTYDWKGAGERNLKERERLREKYERDVLLQYKISKAELETIKTEGLAQRWPFPPAR